MHGEQHFVLQCRGMLSYSMKFSGFVELILILIESYLTTLRTTLLACWDILPPIRYSAFRETLNLRGSAEAASRHTDGEDTSMTDENRTEPSSVITTNHHHHSTTSANSQQARFLHFPDFFRHDFGPYIALRRPNFDDPHELRRTVQTPPEMTNSVSLVLP